MTLTRSLSKVLSAIADAKSFLILKSIAEGGVDSDVLMKITNLTPKQYYSRILAITNAGLVTRKKKKYYLSSLGKVVYELQIITQSALNNYWKLRAIDSLDSISEREQKHVIENLIVDENLRELLTKKCSDISASNPVEGSLYHQQPEERNHSNLMLVEDEPDIVFAFKAILTSNGYVVDAFTDSFEALKHFVKLNRHYYDLAIFDIRMKGMNGIQLYQKLKSIDDDLRVIFVTGLDAAEELVSILPDLDSLHIIRKPVSAQCFMSEVKKALTQFHLRSLVS
jgi:CheY-like chemotaxis protein/DNA-binding HxlR family transcriptional regulator